MEDITPKYDIIPAKEKIIIDEASGSFGGRVGGLGGTKESIIKQALSDTNIIIGSHTAPLMTDATQSVLIGTEAGYNFNSISGSTPAAVTYLGYQAGYTGVNVGGNICIGRMAGKYETGGLKLFIDSLDRTDEATGRTNSLIYGIMASATADQYIYLNAGHIFFNQTEFSPSDISNPLKVHEKTVPDLGLVIDAGVFYQGTTKVVCTGIANAVTTSPAANPRIDFLCLSTDGVTPSYIKGTEAASPSEPSLPTAADNKIVLAKIYRRVGETAIRNTDNGTDGYIMTDIRPLLNSFVNLEMLSDGASRQALTTGTQTIAGEKTFSTIPILPASDPTTANQAARKSYVDGKAGVQVIKGQDSRTSAAGAGTQTITHNAGTAAKHILIHAFLADADAQGHVSTGQYTVAGTNTVSGISSLSSSPASGQDTTNIISFTKTSYAWGLTDRTWRAAVTSNNLNEFILTWTMGTTNNPTGTCYFEWEIIY